MALLGASQTTQREQMANGLTLANKLELANAKIDTLQKIIHDNGSATEAQLTTFAKQVSEVQMALRQGLYPTEDRVAVMFREWFETQGVMLVRQSVATAISDANEDVMVHDQGEIQSRGRAASVAATISAHTATPRVFPLVRAHTNSTANPLLVNANHPSDKPLHISATRGNVYVQPRQSVTSFGFGSNVAARGSTTQPQTVDQGNVNSSTQSQRLNTQTATNNQDLALNIEGSGLGRGGSSGRDERSRASISSSNSATAHSTNFNTPANSQRTYSGLIDTQELHVGFRDNSDDATSRELLRNVQSVDTPGTTMQREGNNSILSSSANPAYQQPFVYEPTLLGNKSLNVVTRCTEKALNAMWEHIKEHERKHPTLPLRWQGFFSEAVEETIDEKLGSYALSQSQPYVKTEWKTRHDIWTSDKFFKTLIPLTRIAEENKTPIYQFLQNVDDVIYECREDSTGDYQF
jgi:hypothetical protein